MKLNRTIADLAESEAITHAHLAKALLGWPVTIGLLVLSYIYGIWQLHQLGGPGVHEFAAGKEPPWAGQTRGF